MMKMSMMRIVFDPGGANALVLLDWLQQGQVPALGWNQHVQIEAVANAEYAAFYPRGNVQRQWQIVARAEYASAAAMAQAALDADALLPDGVRAPLHIRVLDLTKATTASEATRTLAHYIAAEASIVSASPAEDEEMLAITTTYVVQLGKLIKQ
jgi:hypothetical protein